MFKSLFFPFKNSCLEAGDVRLNGILNRFGRTADEMTKQKVISLFSGAGGMDIGFEQAGFEIAVAVEIDPSCCDTLRKNRPARPVLECDISTVSTATILDVAKLKVAEAALVIGGPPCQSFSLAGKRLGMEDPRGRLVLDFIRVVREALPVGFVMENVRGMENWQGGKALNAILEAIAEPIFHNGKKIKYNVEYKILNAADFGAPQMRERIFLVGNRIDKKFSFPKPTYSEPTKDPSLFDTPTKEHRTVWDAIGKLPPANEPSEMAKRISATIADRIEKHGY
jgi:DNA (cytosine-5)-methyltransferase 1